MRRTVLILVLVAMVVVVVYLTWPSDAAAATGVPKGDPLGPAVFPERNPAAATAAGIDCSNPQTANAPECQHSRIGTVTNALKKMGLWDQLTGAAPIPPGSPVVPHAQTSPVVVPPPSSLRGGGSSSGGGGLFSNALRSAANRVGAAA